MRVAIVSDTHLGDDLCVLVAPGEGGGSPVPGPGYAALRDAVGHADYLVLLGDIIDFSVASYDRAYRDAKAFFLQVQRDRLAREILYVPGNHDFDIWTVVEHQVNVINRLKEGELPRPFHRAVPGVLDLRERKPRLRLPDVAAHPEWHERRSDYGGLFLDHITLEPSTEGRRKGRGERSLFDFAYPNLYLVTPDGETVLLTHGHYFEAYWALLGEWALQLAGGDLPLEHSDELSVRELVGVNFPLNQLASSGVGQAYPLSRLARTLQLELYAGRPTLFDSYLRRLQAAVADRVFLGIPFRPIRSWLAARARGRLVAAFAATEQTRFSRAFLSRPAVRQRVRRYYRACLAEIQRLREVHGLDLAPPGHVVFGHTHQPIPWGSDELVDDVDGRELRFCNTGGWVLREGRDGKRDFVGAEVLLFETGLPPRSVSIRSTDLQ
jgi:UDP-2,3-diacylglucosamine pyrophosphatase LpxH